MPPPAAQTAPPPSESGATSSLEDAAARLEAALARLEALVEAGPFQSELFRASGEAKPDASAPNGEETQALRSELAAVRGRERALEAAATAASQALGEAMADIREVLEADDVEAPPDGEALDPADARGEEPKS